MSFKAFKQGVVCSHNLTPRQVVMEKWLKNDKPVIITYTCFIKLYIHVTTDSAIPYVRDRRQSSYEKRFSVSPPAF
jgi:hypothetical protein